MHMSLCVTTILKRKLQWLSVTINAHKVSYTSDYERSE